MGEPLWTLTELVQNKKISMDALRGRYKSERCRTSNPLPAPKSQSDLKGSGKAGNTCGLYYRRGARSSKRYLKSELLAWFDAEDAHFKFRRIG